MAINQWRHLALGKITSTNEMALQKADEGDAGRLWITASEQTAGRARRGRKWVSSAGNLYASLLLIAPFFPGHQLTPERLGEDESLVTLPLMVSLVLHQALVDCVPESAPRLKIKWPNDLLLDGKKISGILIESKVDHYKRLAIVIGCGINCVDFPDKPLYPATSLKAEGLEVETELLFEQIKHRFCEYFRLWAGGAGFAILRQEWLNRATGVGEEIVARFSNHEVKGRFIDINQNGFLMLEDKARHIHYISAADIFFKNDF